MKKLIQLPLLLGAVLLLGACSTISTRIEEKASVFYSLDPNTRAKIAHGDIDLGFTPDMVYIALGSPDATRHQVSQEGPSEQWIYRSYYEDYSGFGPGFGPGWGPYFHRWYAYDPFMRHYRFYWEPISASYYHAVPHDDIRVTFRNGRVVLIDQARA